MTERQNILNSVPIIRPNDKAVLGYYLASQAVEWASVPGFSFPKSARPGQLASFTAAHVKALAVSGLNNSGRTIVPISARALIEKDAAAEVVEAFRLIPEGDRKRLVIEIHNFPAKINLATVEEALFPLLPFTDAFVARMPLGLEDATAFANCNYLALTTDFADLDMDSPFANLLAVTGPRRLKTFIWNLPEAYLDEANQNEVFGATAPL
ncbi:MAG: hypothetical protein ACPGOV_00420 [Magnetovibrionaceae bacterium]